MTGRFWVLNLLAHSPFFLFSGILKVELENCSWSHTPFTVEETALVNAFGYLERGKDSFIIFLLGGVLI